MSVINKLDIARVMSEKARQAMIGFIDLQYHVNNIRGFEKNKTHFSDFYISKKISLQFSIRISLIKKSNLTKLLLIVFYLFI